MISIRSGKIKGLIAKWGDEKSRDSYGTFFNKDNPPNLGLEYLPIPMFYEHGTDSVIGKEPIGVVEKAWVSELGVEFEGSLHETPFTKKIEEEVNKGLLATSSGTMNYLADFTENGEFKNWYLGELSLTKNPSEGLMPNVTFRKYNNLYRMKTMDNENVFSEEEVMSLEETLAELLENYSIEQIMEVLNTEPRAEDEEEDEEENDMKRSSEFSNLRSEIENLKKELNKKPDINEKKVNRSTISNVVDKRFDHLSPRDMACGYVWMNGLYRSGKMDKRVSEDYVRAMSSMVDDARSKDRNAAYATRNIRSGELMGSTVSGYGDEWVGVFYDSSLWEVVRQDTMYQTLMTIGMTEREVPQGTESIKLMLEGSDATWYAVGQTKNEDSTGQPQTNLSSSKFGTSNQDLTVGKIGAAFVINGELEEDSLISVIPEARRKLDIGAQETIEYLLINGDTVTTASTNINLIDGTPSATALNSMPIYTALNGFLKMALVTNTDNSRDAGALDIYDYLKTAILLGDNGKNAAQKDRIAYIVDNMTYFKTLQLPEFLTKDVSSVATSEGGEITKIWGSPLHVSGQMALANSSGKISATSSNNAYGRILCVRPDQWVLGWKRRTTTEVQRYARADATELVTYMRLGFIYRDTEASAVSYNVTV